MSAPRVITFGEIMGRLATSGSRRFQQCAPGILEVTFAGAEVNVAVAVASLGGESAFITALPKHELAEAALKNLRGLGVDTRHTVRSDTGRLGLFFLEHGVNQRPARVIYDRSGSCVSLLPAESYDWDGAFTGHPDWFHLSGVTPAISAVAADVARHAMQRAASAGVPVSFDMNFRSRLWQWEPGTPPEKLAARTARSLLPHAQLFLGGPQDIAGITGEPLSPEDPVTAARQLAEQFPNLKYIAMTRRETLSASHHRLSGFLCDTATGETFQAPLQDGVCVPYDMPGIVDRPGGGDAFAAGLLLALATPELSAPATAVAFATAASCLTHTIPGDFALLQRIEVEALMNGGGAGHILR